MQRSKEGFFSSYELGLPTGWIFSPSDAATLHKAGKAARAETQISDKTAERSDINRDILTLSWEHLQAARRSADV